MIRNKLIVILVGVFMMGVALIGSSIVNADTVLQSMTVSPTSKRIALEPGESYTDTLEVSNYNSSIRDLEYSVEVGSFNQVRSDTSEDDYGVVDHVNRTNYNQIMDWITLEKESGRVAPNEVDAIKYTINVPEDAPAGAQYATIVVRDNTGKSEEGDGNIAIDSIYQFASVIFAEVAGETREEGEIRSNTIPTFLFNGPLTASSMVKNDGNIYTDAKYTLEVWPLFSDEEVYTNAENPEKNMVLPGTERYVVQSWDDAPSIGIFKVRQTVEIFGEKSFIEKNVIICPLWLIIVVLIVIAMIVVWVVVRQRKRRREN